MLVFRYWRYTGIERRANRQQRAACDQRLHLVVICGGECARVAADWQRRAALVDELPYASFAAVRIDHRLSEQRRLAGQAGADPFSPTRPNGVQQPPHRDAAPGPGRLAQHNLQMRISQRFGEVRQSRLIPSGHVVLPALERLTESARAAVMGEVAHQRMRSRKHIDAAVNQFVDNS